MAYTTIDDPTLYFSSTIWTGNGVDDRAIVIDGTGMQPDFVWIKSRNDTDNHRLVDSVRGATKHLESDGTGAEQTSSNVKAFTSTGVTLSTNGSVNANSELYASWSWKAGTSFTNDASATGIGTIDSAGSVNTDAGFSICSYTGTGSNGTIKHGLSTVPHMIIQKNLTSGTHAWNVYHKNLTSAGYNLNLDGNYAEFTSATTWNSTAPTSSVFSVGTDTNANESGSGHIAYCFAEKKGYSKFGSYTGNGNADGTFVYTGFKPAFVMFKKTSATGNWFTLDNKRFSANGVFQGGGDQKYLHANTSNNDQGGYGNTDILSNGFKFRGSDGDLNGSGATYIYMAFAENPFVTSTGVPATAK